MNLLTLAMNRAGKLQKLPGTKQRGGGMKEQDRKAFQALETWDVKNGRKAKKQEKAAFVQGYIAACRWNDPSAPPRHDGDVLIKMSTGYAIAYFDDGEWWPEPEFDVVGWKELPE